MLAIPVGLGFGYTADRLDYQLSPFLGYQIMALSGYNRSIPVITETLLQVGASFKNK